MLDTCLPAGLCIVPCAVQAGDSAGLWFTPALHPSPGFTLATSLHSLVASACLSCAHLAATPAGNGAAGLGQLDALDTSRAAAASDALARWAEAGAPEQLRNRFVTGGGAAVVVAGRSCRAGGGSALRCAGAVSVCSMYHAV